MKLITKDIEKRLEKYPLYSQDGKGDDAIIVCKFFLGGFTWYVLEAEKLPDGKYNFYGIVRNDGIQCCEYGYFSLEELEKIKAFGFLTVERDMYFEPKRVGDCTEATMYL